MNEIKQISVYIKYTLFKGIKKIVITVKFHILRRV